jgi:uncharacterized membrane protein YGL010W
MPPPACAQPLARTTGASKRRTTPIHDMLQLNREWSRLLSDYKNQHKDPRNQACHRIGIPLIAASFPIGATLIGLPLAATMFTVGWGFQFLGHHFEGNDPAFFSDPRNLLVGLVWWAQKSGLPVTTTTDANA